MELIETRGNVLDVGADIIMHGCNTKGKMGSGLAYEVSNRFPEAHYADLHYDLPFDESRLGNFSHVKVTHPYSGKKFTIVNLYTQDTLGRGRVNTDVEAMRIAFRKALHELTPKTGEPLTVAVPMKMCSDLGGADWNEVKPILIEEASNFNIIFKIVEFSR